MRALRLLADAGRRKVRADSAGGKVRLKPSQRQQFAARERARSRGQCSSRGTSGNFLLDGVVRKQSVFLNHVTDMPPQVDRVPLGGPAVFHAHFALRGFEQAVDEFQRGGLSCAAAAQKHQSFAPVHRQADACFKVWPRGSL